MSHLDAYIDRVTSVLAAEFDWDDTTAAAFRGAFLRSHNGRLEFICDSPVSARWRVKSNHESDHPWALRMAYYGDNPDRQTKAEAMTVQLVEALP